MKNVSYNCVQVQAVGLRHVLAAKNHLHRRKSNNISALTGQPLDPSRTVPHQKLAPAQPRMHQRSLNLSRVRQRAVANHRGTCQPKEGRIIGRTIGGKVEIVTIDSGIAAGRMVTDYRERQRSRTPYQLRVLRTSGTVGLHRHHRINRQWTLAWTAEHTMRECQQGMLAVLANIVAVADTRPPMSIMTGCNNTTHPATLTTDTDQVCSSCSNRNCSCSSSVSSSINHGSSRRNMQY